MILVKVSTSPSVSHVTLKTWSMSGLGTKATWLGFGNFTQVTLCKSHDVAKVMCSKSCDYKLMVNSCSLVRFLATKVLG